MNGRGGTRRGSRRRAGLAGLGVAWSLVAAACAPLAVVVAPPVPAVTEPARAADSRLAGPARFTGTLAYTHVAHLADDIGIREAGTANDEVSANYLADTLRGYGYDVTIQPFPFTYFKDAGSSLSVEGDAVETRTLGYSGSGDVTGPLIDVGLGRREDYPTDATGKIALIQRGELTFAAKLANANAAGVLGAVIYNNQDGLFQGTAGGAMGGAAAIPAVSISRADGQSLVQRVRAGGVRAHLVATTIAESRTSSNVVARLADATGPRIVVGGHRDSVPQGPGANDNGSGTATVLEMARVVAQTRPPIDYRFVLFGAEELGLLGSRYYVDQLSAADRAAIKAMINLDMVGVGDDLRIGGTDTMARLGIAVAKENGVNAGRLGSGLNGASDHASFMQAGIPSIFFYWSDDPNYHTANDRAEFVKPDLLQKTGDFALAVAERVAAGAE